MKKKNLHNIIDSQLRKNDDLKELNAALNDENKKLAQLASSYAIEINELKKELEMHRIARVVHNSKKNTTVVWFKDGTKKIVHRKDGVRDCVYTAVAFAVVEKIFGSNSSFQNEVDKKNAKI